MLRRLIPTFVFMTLLPIAAFAQDNTDDVAFDEYSALSEQLLLLKGNVQTTLNEPQMNLFYDEYGFYRFKRSVAESDPNTKGVQDWCMLVVQGTQIRRDQVDENFDAEITQRAVEERCSDVYKYDANIRHECGPVSDDNGNKYAKCKVDSSVTFFKFRAVAANGAVSWVSDTTFGSKGQATIRLTRDAKVGYGSDNPYEKAAAKALETALKNAAMFSKRKMLDIRQFQLHAPIISAKKGYAKSCLGRDTVELDLPFIVVFNGGGKEVKKGFAKARKIYDGCTMTPELQQIQDRGGKVDLRPMESQIILGGKKVKPGYTMWEMPTIGLNVGGAVGFGQSMAGFGTGSLRVWPTANIELEQSLARKTGISEFHTWETIRFSGVGGADYVKDFNAELMAAMPAVVGLIPLDSALFMLQVDAGVLKRWYASFFFFGLGAGINISYNIALAGLSDYTPTAMGIGGNGLLELGFQLAPRFILDIKLGYRFEAALAMLLKDGKIEGDVNYMGIYHGPSASINLLYNF